MDTPSRTPEGVPNCCPACGGEVHLDPSSPLGDVPCPHCGHLLWFLKKSIDDVVILTFLPGLTSGSESFERVDEVSSMLGASPRLILNLFHLRIVSSMFLGMLVVLHRRVLTANGTLKLCGLRPEAAAAFKVTRLDMIFDIHDDEQDAMESS